MSNNDLQKKIDNITDTLKGEICRICVTNDSNELVDMCGYAHYNIDKLFRLIIDERIKCNNSFDDVKAESTYIQKTINPNYSPFDNSLSYIYKCAKCGKRLKPDDCFCSNCGRYIIWEE